MPARCQIVFLLLLTAGCTPREPTPASRRALPSEPESMTIEISMTVHREVYEKTDFGEPPQIAIWLEDPATGDIRTVWVANRAGRRLWKGKFECPTALPHWESRHRNEKSDYKERGLLQRLIDAVTGATPTGGLFKAAVSVPRGSTWDYFLEVNASADFNTDFPNWSEEGYPDHDINGQPSLVYGGRIAARPGASDIPRLVGRTDQWIPVDHIIEDVTGMSTALQLITGIRVRCISKDRPT